MEATGIHGAELILLLLLLFVAVFAALARRLETPYPIVLVIAGVLLGFVPGIPRIVLEPELIFLVVLPPLLYAAAWVTSWRDFSHNLVSISMLAFGLVGFTVAGVAMAGPWLFAGFDWRVGFVLGAVVATTDAIAAAFIAKRIRLPQAIVRLAGRRKPAERCNRAAGLGICSGDGGSRKSNGQLRPAAPFVLTFAGIGSGLLLARIVEWFEHRIHDGPIEIAVSILVPYAAYLTARPCMPRAYSPWWPPDCTLAGSSEPFSPNARLRAQAVWNSLTFILNGLVFVLIGLQLPYVLEGMNELTSGAYFLWRSIQPLPDRAPPGLTFPGAYVSHVIRTRLLHQNESRPGVRQIFVVGWTGMRGVIALAAAMSLPQTIADGSPFPSGLDRLFDVLRDPGDAGVPGTHAASADPDLGFGGAFGPKCEDLEARRLVLEAAHAGLERLPKQSLWI